MMKNNLTEPVFILDRSGSMAGFESDTIGDAIHHIGNNRCESGLPCQRKRSSRC